MPGTAQSVGRAFLPGDGEDTGDKYEIPIDTTLGLTNLEKDLATGNEPLGTFDLGSNRLTASVTDDLGNRSFG